MPIAAPPLVPAAQPGFGAQVGGTMLPFASTGGAGGSACLPPGAFVGFSTGRGASVAVSDAALSRSAALLSECEEGNEAEAAWLAQALDDADALVPSAQPLALGPPGPAPSPHAAAGACAHAQLPPPARPQPHQQQPPHQQSGVWPGLPPQPLRPPQPPRPPMPGTSRAQPSLSRSASAPLASPSVGGAEAQRRAQLACLPPGRAPVPLGERAPPQPTAQQAQQRACGSVAKPGRSRPFVSPYGPQRQPAPAAVAVSPPAAREGGERPAAAPPADGPLLSLFDLEAHKRRPCLSLAQMRQLYAPGAASGFALVPSRPAGNGTAACGTAAHGANALAQAAPPAQPGGGEWRAGSVQAVAPAAAQPLFAMPPNGPAPLSVERMLALLRAAGGQLHGSDGVGWVERHLRQLLPKLRGYEAAWPSLRGLALTEERVLRQLRYRYEREVVRNERSVLRRIVEGDSHAAQPLVLLLAAAPHTPPLAPNGAGAGAAAPSATTGGGESVRVVLSDGWHFLDAQLDATLSRRLRSGALRPGLKLVLVGCRLDGAEDGAPCLAVHANGARLARWDARLGRLRCRKMPHFSLRTLVPGGGVAPSVCVAVQRHYAVQCLHKAADGSRTVRSLRLEQAEAERCAERHSSALAQWLDALRRAADKSTLLARRPAAPTGAELSALFDEEPQAGVDIAALLLALTEQRDLATAERQLAQLDEAQLSALSLACGGLRPPELAPPERKVHPFCRLALSDLATGALAELTVWRPPEHLLEAGKLEGSCWQLSFVEALELRDQPLRLADALAPGRPLVPAGAPAAGRPTTEPLRLALMTTNRTTWTPLPAQPGAFLPRSPLPFSQLHALRTGDEFCTVGALLHVSEPLAGHGQDCFNAFVAAAGSADVLCVRVRAEAHWLARAQPLFTIALTDLRYVSYDAQYGTHLANADDDAPSAVGAAPSHARGAAEALAARLRTDPDCRAHFEARRAYVLRLVSGQVPAPANQLAICKNTGQGLEATVRCNACGEQMPQARLGPHMELCLTIGMSLP